MSRSTLGFLCVLGLGGCGALELLGRADTGPQVPPAVQRAFDDSCASSDCHSGPFPPASLDLSAGASAGIIGRASSELPELPLVEIGNLQGSYLALKLLPADLRGGVVIEGERMPLEGEQKSEDVALILGWIGGAELPEGGPETPTSTPTGTPSGTATGTPTTPAGPAEDCSLWGTTERVDSPVIYGTASGEIPPVPGHIIEANCGCHTVEPDELADWVLPPPDNGFRVNTLADWQQGEVFGVPAIGMALARVQALNMPLVAQCGVKGSGGSLTPGDYEVLVAWLEAGAPDAPTWEAMQ